MGVCYQVHAQIALTSCCSCSCRVCTTAQPRGVRSHSRLSSNATFPRGIHWPDTTATRPDAHQARSLVPGATIRPSPSKNLEVTSKRGDVAGDFIPKAALRTKPFQRLQLASVGSGSTGVASRSVAVRTPVEQKSVRGKKFARTVRQRWCCTGG